MLAFYFKWYTSDANFFPHFFLEHFQIPLETLFAPSFSQKGHFCFTLCFTSTATRIAFDLFPYLAPKRPADFVFFNFVGIFMINAIATSLMGLPGFEPGSSGPKPERLPSYPTAPLIKRAVNHL